MQIESYSFGRIVIDGTEYDSDVIIFPDHVTPHWYRIEGHSLDPGDLAEVLAFSPDILIVGTGAAGVMKIPPETKGFLKEHQITLIAEKTAAACKTFNKYLAQDKKVAAALHLTC
jgi:hypothetical protein